LGTLTYTCGCRASPAVPYNSFPITNIGRRFSSSFRIILWELLLESPIIFSQYNNILGEHEPSLYLRRVGVKYWDNPIVIGEREMYWRTTGAHPFPNSGSLLGNGRPLKML